MLHRHTGQDFFTNLWFNIVKAKYNFFRFLQVYEFVNRSTKPLFCTFQSSLLLLSFYVLLCPYSSFSVLTSPFLSLIVLLSPYQSLYVLISPFLSFSVLFHPYQSFSVLTCPFRSLLVLFCSFPSFYILTSPIVPLSLLFCPLQSLLVLLCPYQSCSVLTCPFLSLLVLFSPYQSFPVLALDEKTDLPVQKIWSKPSVNATFAQFCSILPNGVASNLP